MNAAERYAEIEKRISERLEIWPRASWVSVELVNLRWLLARCRVLDRFHVAYDRCDSHRGAFSCVEPHDGRCPKFRMPAPPLEAIVANAPACECGRDELDAADAALSRSEEER